MKNAIALISFFSASILAGIGIEDFNTLAMAGGVVFMVLTVAMVMSECATDKNNE